MHFTCAHTGHISPATSPVRAQRRGFLVGEIVSLCLESVFSQTALFFLPNAFILRLPLLKVGAVPTLPFKGCQYVMTAWLLMHAPQQGVHG